MVQINWINIATMKIDKSIHREINPLYLKKLEKIQKQKGLRFKSVEEFEGFFSK